MSAKRGGLGTNLDSLIPTSLTVAGNEVAQQNEVSIDSISPNPRQPRSAFDETALNELTASIKEIGILQPPVVRQTSTGKYELVMGERRFRAAKAAGLKTIPVIILPTDCSVTAQYTTITIDGGTKIPSVPALHNIPAANFFG